MSFLKAEWRKLAFVNYEINQSVLESYVPAGTELDFWEGKCYISLVGFMFCNTRLLGVKIPFHSNFEEVNLRFYVKRQVNNEWKRGVVFIKEIVPKPALTFVANTIYNENYETRPMQHSWYETNEQREVEYKWKTNSKWQSFKVIASKIASKIKAGSEAEFITEHYWGYAKRSKRISNEYEVRHPKWLQYNIIDYTVAVDFARTYGPEFGFLTNSKPVSIMLVEGSEISVENKLIIKS